MAIDPQKSYTQTPSKLRVLWDIAQRLIGDYEYFDSRMTILEDKFTQLSYKINSIIDRIKNV